MLAGDVEALTRSLIRKAKAGHGAALQLVFDRIAPARRDRHVELDLPPIETAADLSMASVAIVDAVAAGKLTPMEAQSVANLLEQRRRIIETVDYEARLAAVESALAKQSNRT
jgi:hypothetical protein